MISSKFPRPKPEPADGPAAKGRAVSYNPTNRFVQIGQHRDEDAWIDLEEPSPKTQFLPNKSRTILTRNDSPDVGGSVTLNTYRGCEHGCVYCYARPTHETFGFSAGLDFETKILVKHDAPVLLKKELSSKSWKPTPIMMSGVTDCYQPVEKRLGLTRSCLKVLLDFRNPVFIITKNHLVTRDIDILKGLAAYNAAAVLVSVTTLEPDLCRWMEPRTSLPAMRLDAIRQLSAAGIPVGVNVAPMIPGLTDHEMPMIIKAAVEAGARQAGYIPIRLPHGVADLFEQWLHDHFPDRAQKVVSRIREIRGGKMNDSDFHSRMEGKGVFADQFRALFYAACKKYGLPDDGIQLSADHFRRNTGPDLFLS